MKRIVFSTLISLALVLGLASCGMEQVALAHR